MSASVRLLCVSGWVRRAQVSSIGRNEDNLLNGCKFDNGTRGFIPSAPVFPAHRFSC